MDDTSSDGLVHRGIYFNGNEAELRFQGFFRPGVGWESGPMPALSSTI